MKQGMYKHYKGKYYEVLGIALHTESQDKMVLYRGLYDSPELTEEYGCDPLYVRPYDMFAEQVKVDGLVVPRFTYVGPMKKICLS